MKFDNGKLTIRLCYLGMFVMAIAINLSPVLFIPLKEQLGLTFEQLGRLILINFATQVAFDLICGALVDRVGPKRFVVAAPALAFVGLWVFALAPSLMGNPYHGLIIGTVIFSAGSGILELLLSPIINAVPSDQKGSDMSLLHSFYAWGQVVVILLTALAVFAFGARHWQWFALVWSIPPAIAAVGFSMVKLPPFVEEAKRQRVRDLVRKPAYLVAVAALGLAGASELSIGQWISAFADKGLGFPKIEGDLAGLCLFAAALGIGRVWFGLNGQKVCMYRMMLAGAWLSVGTYLLASLSPWPYVSLGACVLAGLGVSLLWPGMLVVTAARFPLAGASMFALLSASGDTGGAVAPWLVGAVADKAPMLHDLPKLVFGAGLTPEQTGLRVGLLLATIYPLAMVALLYWLRANARKDAAVPAVEAEA